jgi:hypothetical protein
MQAQLLAVLTKLKPERNGVGVKLGRQRPLDVRRYNTVGMVAPLANGSKDPSRPR